jgi:hypothetical protein
MEQSQMNSIMAMSYQATVNGWNYRITRKDVDNDLWAINRWPGDEKYHTARAEMFANGVAGPIWWPVLSTPAADVRYIELAEVMQLIEP